MTDPRHLRTPSGDRPETHLRWQERIELNPAILAGKPIVRGTRLSVPFVIGLLADGWSVSQVEDEYPGLTDADIRACLHYASEALRADPLRGISG